MDKTPGIPAALFLLIFLAALPNAASAQDIVGKVIAGYQGWFCAPGDGSPEGSLPDHRGNYHSNWETYPDLREWPSSEQFPTPDKWGSLPNGSPATAFSSDRDFTINRHVGWMKQYGIDCAAVQRFGEVATNPTLRDQKNDVTVRMMRACEKIGVKFYIEYDASGSGGHGWGDDWVASIQNDWRTFGVGRHIAASPAYAKQNGKTVVELWGMGLDANGISRNADQWLTLVRWFQGQGCYVIGGVPTGWLSTSRFHDALPGFEAAYTACDAISPWVVGRFSGVKAADAYAEGNLKPELAWCRQHKIDYIPCVYPGTSFYNSNQRPKNLIPREHGLLLWQQFANLRHLGIKTCFVSMFDEYNEATAIAKSAEDASFTPSDRWFLCLDADGVPLSSDFYLRVTLDGGDMLKGRTALNWTLPTPPWNDLMATSFENGQLQPAWKDSPDTTFQGGLAGVSDYRCSVRTDGKAQSGTASLMVSGTANGGRQTHCYCKVFDLSDSRKVIGPDTLLYYWIYPEQDNARYVALDIQFTDGTTLSTSPCVDQNGHPLRPSAGHGGSSIPLNAWSVVTSRLGALSGKRIKMIRVGFDHPGATGPYRGYIDDIRISN
jgi:hypothetical protein